MNQKTSFKIDKDAVARCFGKAAANYDKHAELQRITSDKLLSLIPEKNSTELHVMDLGCGSGALLPALALRSKTLTAVDISVGMLNYARENHTLPVKQYWINADAEALPFADNSIDLVVSNLAVQWCDDLSIAVNELTRVLKFGGSAVISTVCHGSLYEIQQSWGCIDDERHVNKFLTLDEIQHAVAQNSDIKFTLSEHTHTMYFPDVKAAIQSIKGIGASHVQGKQGNMSSKSKVEQFLANYQSLYIPNEGLPLTYQIAYFVITKVK